MIIGFGISIIGILMLLFAVKSPEGIYYKDSEDLSEFFFIGGFLVCMVGFSVVGAEAK
jgi:hypothetical protein